MATQAQIDANRRNAQKSTGPKTLGGKARASLNAIRHGVRAENIVASLDINPLFDESPREFADLVQILVDKFHPEGAAEEMCIESIAINQWRLRRLDRAEIGHIASCQRGLLLSTDPDNSRLRARNALPEFEELERLDRYDTSVERKIDRALSRLTRLQAQRLAAANEDTEEIPPRTAPPSGRGRRSAAKPGEGPSADRASRSHTEP